MQQYHCGTDNPPICPMNTDYHSPRASETGMGQLSRLSQRQSVRLTMTQPLSGLETKGSLYKEGTSTTWNSQRRMHDYDEKKAENGCSSCGTCTTYLLMLHIGIPQYFFHNSLSNE